MNLWIHKSMNLWIHKSINLGNHKSNDPKIQESKHTITILETKKCKDSTNSETRNSEIYVFEDLKTTWIREFKCQWIPESKDPRIQWIPESKDACIQWISESKDPCIQWIPESKDPSIQ